jgi:hypothetical protein
VKLPTIGPEMLEEFQAQLAREGHSEDFIDGALEGIIFVLEFYITCVTLQSNKNKLLRGEYNVPAQIAS